MIHSRRNPLKRCPVIRTVERSDGFTLIELLVGIAVFIALSVVAAPSIRGMVDNMSGNRAVHEIMSDLNVAKSLAVRHGRPSTVAFDNPVVDQYTVTWNVPAQNRVVDLAGFRTGIQFEPNPPGLGGPSPPPIANLTFSPQGFATQNGSIYITDQNNSEVIRIEVLFSGAISEMRWSAANNQWIYK